MKNTWRKWLVLAKKFGNFQANILLSIIYFMMIVPIGFLFRISGKFSQENFNKSGYWLLRKKVKQDISWARKQ